MSGRKSKKPAGWEGEPVRHALARQGVETTPPHFGQVFAGAGILKTKVTEVWSYAALPEEAKQKALDRYWDINVDHEWWDYDGLMGFSEKEMERMSPEWQKKYFALKGELISAPVKAFDIGRSRFLQLEIYEIADEDLFYEWLGIPDGLRDKGLYFTFSSPAGEGNTQINFGSDLVEPEFTKKDLAAMDMATERFGDKVEEALSGLEESYEYLLSDEAVAETLIANEYEFTMDGEIY